MHLLLARVRVHEDVPTHLLRHRLVWDWRPATSAYNLLGQGVLSSFTTLAITRLEAELVFRRRVAAATAHLAIDAWSWPRWRIHRSGGGMSWHEAKACALQVAAVNLHRLHEG